MHSLTGDRENISIGVSRHGDVVGVRQTQDMMAAA